MNLFWIRVLKSRLRPRERSSFLNFYYIKTDSICMFNTVTTPRFFYPFIFLPSVICCFPKKVFWVFVWAVISLWIFFFWNKGIVESGKDQKIRFEVNFRENICYSNTLEILNEIFSFFLSFFFTELSSKVDNTEMM